MSKKASGALLTETELELMNILWQQQEATVRDILSGLGPQRKMAYTSASTIIRILEQKGFVRSRKEGKSHVYQPVLKKSAYEQKTLDHVVKNVFDDSALTLVQRLIGDAEISEDEKQEIKRLIAEEL